MTQKHIYFFEIKYLRLLNKNSELTYLGAYLLERARFGEHLHQLRQRVLRPLRDVGDIHVTAVNPTWRQNRQ